MEGNTLIIGGGLAGLISGIKLTEFNEKVILFTRGMSSLHFATGCIDLYGRKENPYQMLPFLPDAHPYTLCGEDTIRVSMDFFLSKVNKLSYSKIQDNNQKRIAASGKIVSTYLAPAHSPILTGEIENLHILTFAGYKGFIPEIVKMNLLPYIKNISTGEIPIHVDSITGNKIADKNPDLIAEFIQNKCKECTHIILPSLPGFMSEHKNIITLENLSNKKIYEMPTLPPSVPGQRLERELRDIFTATGGILITGDAVCEAEFLGNKVQSVTTDSGHKIQANNYILATGSFLSGGITSGYNQFKEPIFNLKISNTKELSDASFFNRQNFTSIGVVIDENFRGIHANGFTVENLFCCGGVLGGYDAIFEGSGGGVSIASGFACAQKIQEVSSWI